MLTSFEIGAVFSVVDQATVPLGEIGRAFESLADLATDLQTKLTTLGDKAFTGLKASVDAAAVEIDRLIVQAGELSRAWGTAGIGGGAGGGAGRGGGRRGGGGADDAEREAERQLREDRLNADAENRNANQIYAREHAAALREKADRDRAQKALDAEGPIGPPDRPLPTLADHVAADRMNTRHDTGQRMNAEAENRNADQIYSRQEAMARQEAANRRAQEHEAASRAGGRDDIIQTIVDYELLHMAFYSAGAEQQSLFRGTKAFNVDPTTELGGEIQAMLRKAARDAAANTAYKESGTAAGIPLLAGPFGLKGVEGARAFADIYPEAARAAEGMELLDPANKFEATLPAMMEYMHETRQYDPTKLKHTYDVLGAVTSLVPHTTFAAEAGAMGYVTPLAKAAGMTPDETAIMVGTLQQAGLRGTIGATTLRQELVGLTRGGEALPKTRHSHSLHAETRQFEHDLHLQGAEGDAINAATQGNAHQLAMKHVGLFDAKGHRTFLFSAEDEAQGLGEKGGVNARKANQIFSKWSETATPADVLQMGNDLFGIRGEMAPVILGQIIKAGQVDYGEQFRSNVSDRVNTPGGFLEAARAQMSRTATQEAGQITARFNDILSHLADATLPAFQGAMEHGLIPLLNKIAGLTAPDAAGKYTPGQRITAYTGVGAAAGGLVGGALGFFAGGIGAFPGAAGGAAIGAALFGGGSAAYEASQLPWFGPPGSGPPLGAYVPMSDRVGIQPMTARNGPRPENLPVAASTAAPVSISVTINNAIQGILDEAMWANIMSKMTTSVKDALSHITADGHGSEMSPYPVGAGY